MRTLIPLAALFLASACQVGQQPENEVATANDTDAMPAPEPAVPPPSDQGIVPAPGSAPAPTPPAASTPAPAPADPVPPTPDSEKSTAAATRVVEDYFAAVATRQYRKAYAMWGNDGQATGMTFAQFRDSFAKYRVYDGNHGRPGDMEGAAGSAYIEFPIKVTGVLAKGGGFVLEGPMTLRRVNGVDGSTAAQRRWHIASSGLKPRP